MTCDLSETDQAKLSDNLTAGIGALEDNTPLRTIEAFSDTFSDVHKLYIDDLSAQVGVYTQHNAHSWSLPARSRPHRGLSAPSARPPRPPRKPPITEPRALPKVRSGCWGSRVTALSRSLSLSLSSGRSL